ncbi:MAG: PIG-L family deacetylase, partial [Verrucomicrobia bacterium]|nr:PIG-L family deacetylase [Verrucomicrobiota bacterium]
LIQQALAKGAKIKVIFITNGDNNPWPQRYVEKRWFIGPEERMRWGHRRKAEAEDSLQILGGGKVTANFLGLPDAGILNLWNEGDHHLLETLTNELTAWQPTLLVLPCEFDRHSDHRATHMFGRAALTEASVICPVLTYLIHRPWLMKLTQKPKPQIKLELSIIEQDKKLQAILCHKTQMALSQSRFSQFAQITEPYNFSL